MGESGQIGQFASGNCSGPITSDQKQWNLADGTPAKVADQTIAVNPGLWKDACLPWYPVLDQQHGPSVGINFGSGQYHIKQVQIFKSTPECAAEAAEFAPQFAPDVCCHKDAGGFLGVMNANGADSDFGATKDMGFKGSMCAQIGPGHDQTLWQMKYFISR